MEYDKILGDLLGRDDYLVVGKSVVRTDALDKCLGRARFTADYIPKGTVVVKVVRSSQPHALIKRIDARAALEVSGVYTVLTGSDVPGENQVGYAIPDQPLLNQEKVHYVGDPIALVCAEDERSAIEGMDAVEVEYDPLHANLTIDETLEEGSLHIHEGGNVALTSLIRKGDVEEAFSKADVTVEETYETPYQDHMYLEPDVAYAIPEGRDKITVIGAMQSPFLVREKVAGVLGWGLNQVRVIQALTGGAFGGKDDTGPLVSAKAALAAVILRRPAALVFDMEEVVAYTPKRFPARIHYKSGADSEGNFMAAKADIIVDCGAYANRAPFWLWRQTVHAAGPYEVPNVYVDGRAVYTNRVFGGSFRGFGDLAMHFAVETQIDRMAAELGMDPVELRLKNVLTVGKRTTSNQLLESSVGIEKCIRGVVEASDWANRRKPKRVGGRVRGIGVGCAHHGISTSRGAPDWSAASLILNEDGTLTYRTTICELGQGTPIGHAKIVAEILGAPFESIRIEIPDTDTMPNARPTHGSRGLALGGTAAADAALKIRKQMVEAAAALLECDKAAIDLRDGRAFEKGDPSNGIDFGDLAHEMYVRGVNPAAYGFFVPPRRYFDVNTGLGVSYPAYTFAATAVEVDVDLETGQVDVVKVWPAMDIGKAIDPLMVDGQIHGAISQGMGFALMEDLRLDGGRVLNPNFTDYIVPSSLDTPEVAETILVEEPYKHSAFGAKGVGEPSIISIVPAVTNAIYHATGVSFNTVPVTAERLHAALRRREK
jgi:CO/xanthine dehydrogenase Mo-binding subunit